VWELLKDLADRWEVLTAIVVGTSGFIYTLYRLIRWGRAVHHGVIVALENAQRTMNLMTSRTSPTEVSRKTGVFEQRITDALEALRPTCNPIHDEDFSR
jgi:hypothetical protein